MTAACAVTIARPRRFHRFLLPAGALLLVAGLVGVVAGTRSQGSSRALSFAAPSTAASASGLQAISSLQTRLRTATRDADSWGALGSLYVDQARVTADPTWYGKAQGALHKALELKSAGNVGALIGLGKLANARHDFAGGLRWGDRARAAAPDSAAPYGVIGDALIELGRYPEAFAAIQRMVDLRPDLASYSRVSYARELQGDVTGAAAALDAAVHVADNPSDAAFATFQIGELRWNAGDLAGAADAYERATRLDPTFAPPAAALARLHAADGEATGAIADYQAVIARVPAPQYVTELGELYGVAGQRDLAANQAQLLDVEERLFHANGVNVDLETSLYDADHGIRLTDGLGRARAEYARRKSVFVADALAWELHANGRDAEALPLSHEALHLGTRSALFHFHRALIERALGQVDAARADLEQTLAINPHFSILHAPEARKALAAL
jgi:tetratricopeptide (TPR) repeat protein